jgi:hypothetical protein
VGEIDGVHFLVMAYIEGNRLRLDTPSASVR